MDILERWHGYFVPVAPLLAHWEHRRSAGIKITRKDREILTLCFFALCYQHKEGMKQLIGFPNKGTLRKGVKVSDLFARAGGELDDWDAVLCADLENLETEREFYQCQVVGYTSRKEANTDDLITFLEEKKMKRAGGDLRLIIHLEQPTWFDWVKLAIHLQLRRPPCPYSQVFVLSRSMLESLPVWTCRQVFPQVVSFPDLDEDTARALLRVGR